MKIEKIHIGGFGTFFDKNIQGFRSGLNVLYGPNEAGKSTLLDFIRFTLFEYPRSVNKRRPPLNGGNHGGKIQMLTTSGQHLSVYRGGNNKDFELEYDGHTTADEMHYKRLIGNAAIDLYQNIYGITLDELNNVKNLEDSGMEGRIFSIGLGLSGIDLGVFENKLNEEADNYYKKRGSTQKLIGVFNELEEVRAALRPLREKIEEYNHLSEEKSQQEVRLQELNEKQRRLQLQTIELENLSKVYGEYVKYREAEEAYNRLREMEIYPDSIKSDYAQGKKDLINAEKLLQEQQNELADIQRQIDGLNWDSGLSEKADVLEYLKRNVKLYEAALSNNISIQQQISQTESVIVAVRHRLGKSVNIEQLIRLRGTFEIQSNATEVLRKEQKLDAQITTKESEKSRYVQDLAESENKKKKAQQEFEQLQIKTEDDKLAAEKKRSLLKNEYQLAIAKAAIPPQRPDYFPLILSIILLLAGVVLFFLDYRAGAIMSAAIGLVGLIISIIRLKNRPAENRISRNPLDINTEIESLVKNIQQFDDLKNELNSLTEDIARKKERFSQIDSELQKLKDEFTQLQNGWKKFLSDSGIPDNILPASMAGFISNVEEIKRQKKTIDSQKLEKIKNDNLTGIFSSKVKEVWPDLEEVTPVIANDLIRKMSENELKNSRRKSLLEGRKTLADKRQKTEVQIKNIRGQLSDLLAKAKSESEEDFYHHFGLQQQLAELEVRIRNFKENIQTLFGAGRFEEAVVKLGTYQSPSELRQEKEMAELEYENIKEEYDGLRENLGSMSNQIKQMLEPDEMYSLQNKERSLQEELKEGAAEWLNTKIALTMLARTKQKYEKERQPEVIRRSTEYFRKITNNAYEELRVSLSEKQVDIIDSAGKKKHVDALSRGTREQLLLALRLGLIEEYEKNAEPLPVVLDDILVNSDQGRAARLAAVLKDFAANRQVLFFTCHTHTRDLLSSVGANVVEW